METSADPKPSAPLKTTSNQEGHKIFSQRDRIERLSRIRQIVFGSLDGLLVPLGVISGVAGGTGSTKAVIVAGIAEAFAGALSMGAGEFIAGQSEAQVHQAEIADELEEMRLNPEYELREMVELLKNDEVTDEDAPIIAHYLQRNPKFYQKAMIASELGLDMEPQKAKIAESITIALSYIVASIVPLIAYFFLPTDTAFYVSLGLSFLFLVGLGIVKGRLTKMNMFNSVVGIVVVGTVSGLGGFLLGNFLPKLFGY